MLPDRKYVWVLYPRFEIWMLCTLSFWSVGVRPEEALRMLRACSTSPTKAGWELESKKTPGRLYTFLVFKGNRKAGKGLFTRLIGEGEWKVGCQSGEALDQFAQTRWGRPIPGAAQGTWMRLWAIWEVPAPCSGVGTGSSLRSAPMQTFLWFIHCLPSIKVTIF